MSTMLRSLRYVRKLNVAGGRRLGSSSSASLQRVRPAKSATASSRLAVFSSDRSYVTGTEAAVEEEPQPAQLGDRRFRLRRRLNQKRREEETDLASVNVDGLINDLDRKIRVFGKIHIGDVEYIMKVVTEKGEMTSVQALLLIRSCGEFLSLETFKTRREIANTVWNTAKELGVPLDVSHYNAKLLVNLENETDFSPVEVLLEMVDQKIDPNRVTFQRLIEQYCCKGDIAGASKILEHMSQQDIPINENIFNSLIKGHSQAGDMISAVKVLDLMKQAGIEPSSRTYTAVLCAHAKKGDVASIRTLITECEQKEIFLSNSEILEVIYTLAINDHSEHVDELIALLSKTGTYNRDAVHYIQMLIDKNQLDTAFKLLKTLVKTKNNEDNGAKDGVFFIRKMIVSNLSVQDIIKYCKLIMDEGINSGAFDEALLFSYIKNYTHLAVPLMKAMKEYGLEIREHYFYPILVSFGKNNNLQGLLNTLKTMHFDFGINASIMTVKDYVVPYMVGNTNSNMEALVEVIPFTVAANAILIDLLENYKTEIAAKFIYRTNMAYRSSLLSRALMQAFSVNKDVNSFVKILYYQVYFLQQKESTKDDENSDEYLNAQQFASKCVSQCIKILAQDNPLLIEKTLDELLKLGISIDETARNKIETCLKEYGLSTPKLQEILSQLTSDELKVLPLNQDRSYSLKTYTTSSVTRLMNQSNISPEFKLLLIQRYARLKDDENVNKSLLELEEEKATYTLGFCASMIDYFSQKLNIDDADKWFKRLLEIDPNAKLDKMKVLRYAMACITVQQPEKAFKALDFPINDLEAERNFQTEKLLFTVCKYYPNQVEEVFNKLKEKGFIQEVTSNLLGPLIKSLIETNQLDEAVKKFFSIAETYRMTPQKTTLMISLINKEDAEKLQQVTDVCTNMYGEMNALYDLSVAFFEAGRPRQARKILETQGLRLKRERIINTAQRYQETGSVERLEGFVQLVKNLYFDIEKLYVFLLHAYEQKGDWEKCLGVWTQMQEENIQPSNKFLDELDRILRSHKQTVPFVRKSNYDNNNINEDFHQALIDGNLEEAERVIQNEPKEIKSQFLLPLIEAYATEKNIDKALSHLKVVLDDGNIALTAYEDTIKTILEVLANDNNFSKIIEIVKLFDKFNNAASQNSKVLSIGRLAHEAYISVGKFDELLTHLENLLNGPLDKTSFSMLLSMPIVRGLLEYPETEERIRNMSIKALEKNAYGILNAVWIYDFLKDNPEADKIWDEHLSKKMFHSISAMYILKDQQAWDKLLPLTEKIIEANMNYDEKRKTFSALLKSLSDCDYSERYNLMFDCLQKIATVIPINRFNMKIIQSLKGNLTGGRNFSDLETNISAESVNESTTG